MGKILITQLGMPIQFQTSYHQPVKMFDQKVGQIKAAKLCGSHLSKAFFTGKKRVAVGARKSLNALFGQ